MSRLNDLLALSIVPRWAIVPTMRSQSVAEHSFRVAVIARELADRLNVRLYEHGLWYALWHDGPESRSGDIPTPFKRLVQAGWPEAEYAACPWVLDQPTPGGQQGIVDVADLIETYTFIQMYGVGPHARATAKSLFLQLRPRCVDAGIDGVLAEILAVEICEEMGRATSPGDVR